MSYNSQYKGAEVEAALDKTKELNIAAIDTNATIDDIQTEYATKGYVDSVIGNINVVLESIINQ